LRGASLEDADLSFVELGDAELSGADFSRTNLAGARVGGADLPYAADHRNVESLGDQDRALLFTLMGLCAYVIVSVGTTSDAQLALNRALLKLPILDVELPLQSFFVGAALVVFGTAYYLSLEQARMIKALSALPRVFPDSSGLSERAHPWLVVVAFSTWFGRDRRAVAKDADAPPPKTEIGTWLLLVSVFALNWGLAPFTVGMLLFRFLASQRADQSYFLWALFAASIVLSYTSFLYARRASGATSGRGVLVASVLLGLFLLTTLPGVLMGLHDFHLSAPRAELSGVDGDKVSGADLEKATLMRADFRMARLDQALLRRARLDGAQLGSASLAGAHAEFATFEGADLSTADLTRTVFWNGNLGRADLTQARATHADLRRADLRAARAARADFSNALAEATRFDGAYLSEARLIQVRAPHANFEGADLDGADLSGAVLSSANLRATHLRGTRFDGTDVTMVDFTGSDLNVFQLCSSNGWRTALLPGDEAPDDTRPFRITQPGPLRQHAESLCPESVKTAP
jgi:uncharacterized protein YjbI with pentapeptide repeats